MDHVKRYTKKRTLTLIRCPMYLQLSIICAGPEITVGTTKSTKVQSPAPPIRQTMKKMSFVATSNHL